MPQGQYTAADIQQQGQFAASEATPSSDWLMRLADWLPTIGGATGGLVGAVGGPPGAVMGAALGGAAGEAYKELMKRARAGIDAPAAQAGVPASPLDASLQMGRQAAIQGAAEGAGQVIGAAASGFGQRVMQSAAKPGVKVALKGVKGGEDVPRVVQTLLDEGVNVTPNGVAKLQRLLSATNQEISDAVAQAPGQIPVTQVTKRLTDVAQRFAGQVNPQADLEAISQVGENFLMHPNLGAAVSVPEAQALKQGTYAQLGKKYGQLSSATVEAEKGLARGLKEEIAARVPEVAGLNAREGRLLEALDVVGRRVALAGNRDPIGFAWVAHNPTTFLAALLDRSPAVKSLIARGLYNSAGTAAKVAPQLIRVAVQSLASDQPMDASSSDRSGQ